jgi:hypothetical protein
MGVFLPESLTSKGFGYKAAANMTIRLRPALHSHLGGQPPA